MSGEELCHAEYWSSRAYQEIVQRDIRPDMKTRSAIRKSIYHILEVQACGVSGSEPERRYDIFAEQGI